MAGSRVHFDISGALAHWADSDGKRVCVEIARAYTNFKNPTGRFEATTYAIRQTSLKTVSIQVRNNTMVGEDTGSPMPLMQLFRTGTGVHGPTGSPIVPKNAKVLYWQGEPNGENYAMSVQGMEPNRFDIRSHLAAERIVGPMIKEVIDAAMKGGL